MFRIGQKVVCVKSHSLNVVTKGEIRIVHKVKLADCGCYMLDVGIIDEGGFDVIWCNGIHNVGTRKEPNIWYVNSNLFRPLEYSTNCNKEIIEKFSPLEEKSDVQIREYEPATN